MILRGKVLELRADPKRKPYQVTVSVTLSQQLLRMGHARTGMSLLRPAGLVV